MGRNGPLWVELGLPSLAAVAGLGVLGVWVRSYYAPIVVAPRPLNVAKPTAAPTQEPPPRSLSPTSRQPAVQATPAVALATEVPGSWPSFRGPDRDNVAKDAKMPGGIQDLKMLWEVPLGEGYAGPAVAKGRVFVLDYDAAGKQDLLRCFSLADGKELWRNGYPVEIKRNHGISRTVPATDGEVVVSLGPKCHVLAADVRTGKTLWFVDLVKEYGTTVPEWYAGQCPLIDDGKVILAPAGNALLVALDLRTGKPLWKTPNPQGWKMTHTSIATATVEGERQYVYAGSGGVAGVSAKDGALRWETTEWTVNTATVPTPVPMEAGRLFLCGGYNAGSMLLALSKTGAKVASRIAPEVFGSDQQTPVYFKGSLYGVAPGGELVCLSPEGKRRWSSGTKARFGLGPYLVADGMLILMNDSGAMTIAEASDEGYRPLGSIQVRQGRESWGPMALAGNRLLVRDIESMACIQLGAG
ncbi:MAG TPA: PQQ-binding-like beta-propeller repeat protein [Fimbriimonas sp.]